MSLKGFHPTITRSGLVKNLQYQAIKNWIQLNHISKKEQFLTSLES